MLSSLRSMPVTARAGARRDGIGDGAIAAADVEHAIAACDARHEEIVIPHQPVFGVHAAVVGKRDFVDGAGKVGVDLKQLPQGLGGRARGCGRHHGLDETAADGRRQQAERPRRGPAQEAHHLTSARNTSSWREIQWRRSNRSIARWRATAPSNLRRSNADSTARAMAS